MIDSYSKLPIGTWLDIRELQETATDEVDLRVAIVALLTGQSERDVLNAPIADFQEWNAAASFLEREPADTGRVASRYVAGKFNLVPTADLRRITTAQFIDFQTFAPEGEKKLPELLSVFLVPEGKVYNDDYDVVEVQDAIRASLSVADTLALSAFFLNKYAAFLRATIRSLARKSRKGTDNPKVREIRERLTRLQTAAGTLLRGGAGSQPSTASPRPSEAPGTTSGL